MGAFFVVNVRDEGEHDGNEGGGRVNVNGWFI